MTGKVEDELHGLGETQRRRAEDGDESGDADQVPRLCAGQEVRRHGSRGDGHRVHAERQWRWHLPSPQHRLRSKLLPNDSLLAQVNL